MSANQLHQFRLKIKFNSCSKHGHFQFNHNAAGTINYHLLCNDAPPAYSQNRSQNKNNKDGSGGFIINFGMAIPSSSDGLSTTMSHAAQSFSPNQLTSQVFDPLKNGEAPYYDIGVTELCVLRLSLGLPRLDNHGPRPSSFPQHNLWQYGDGFY